MTARPMAAARAAVQAIVPDAPEWVEARAIALDDAAWALPASGSGGAGWVIGTDVHRLLVAIGTVTPREAIAALGERPGWTMLAALDRADIVDAARAADKLAIQASILTLPPAALAALPELEGATLLTAEDDLGHLPAPLAEELRTALDRGRPVWTARVDGVPASFAYAPWRSERWFDGAVDTAPGYRQLGLATVVATTMIRGERALGREPVWGADEENLPSLKMAARLGFERVAGLWILA